MACPRLARSPGRQPGSVSRQHDVPGKSGALGSEENVRGRTPLTPLTPRARPWRAPTRPPRPISGYADCSSSSLASALRSTDVIAWKSTPVAQATWTWRSPSPRTASRAPPPAAGIAVGGDRGRRFANLRGARPAVASRGLTLLSIERSVRPRCDSDERESRWLAHPPPAPPQRNGLTLCVCQAVRDFGRTGVTMACSSPPAQRHRNGLTLRGGDGLTLRPPLRGLLRRRRDLVERGLRRGLRAVERLALRHPPQRRLRAAHPEGAAASAAADRIRCHGSSSSAVTVACVASSSGAIPSSTPSAASRRWCWSPPGVS